MKAKLCGWVGCNCVTTNKYYCDKHQAIQQKKRAERDAQRKPFQNAIRWDNYRNPEWKKLSATMLKEVGRCERCGSTERLQVHHIIPIRYAPELFLERSNMMVLCASCHRVETQREINARRR